MPPLWARFPTLTRALLSAQRTAATAEAPFLLIAGLNVLSSGADAVHAARAVAAAAAAAGVPALFKASFDKANRTDAASPRGPLLAAGLPMLAAARAASGLPVLTDIHEPWHAAAAASVADALQIPAFLCRQTDLLAAAAATGLPVNIKKGQFASPAVAVAAADKVRAAGGAPLLTERGVCFGYGRLVVDFAALAALQAARVPVVLDATHAAQTPPDGAARVSGGSVDAVRALARAGAAAGFDGIFLEIAREEAVGPCDGRLQMAAGELAPFVGELVAIARASRAVRGGEHGAAARPQHF